MGYAAQTAAPGWRIAGQDGGQSIDLKDGRSLFLFSDTLLAPVAGGPAPERGRSGWFIGNCAAISTPAATLPAAMSALTYFSDASGRPREIVVPTLIERMGGFRFWPAHGILRDGKIFLFYIGIHQHQLGTWTFKEEGVGLAILDPLTGDCRRIERNGDWRMWPDLPPLTHCGVQMLHEPPIFYVFSSIGDDAFLARVNESHLEDPAACEFFAGAKWTTHLLEAKPIACAAADYSVAFNPYLGCYLMAYVDSHSKVLLLRTAAAPTGAWSEPVAVGVVPHAEESRIVSLGFHHPQFDVDNGRTIFISYSQPHFTQNGMLRVTFA